MSAVQEVTINDALAGFLESERGRLSARVFRRYEEVVELLAASLNGYGHMGLSDAELERFESAFNAGDEEAFCHLFGPDEIVANLDDFLGDFMIRKVIAGPELLRAASTVTKALVRWLRAEGWIDDDALAFASDLTSQAARDLPRAEELACLLYDVIRRPPDGMPNPSALPTADWMDGSLRIERVEPGALWFEGGIGPLDVPSQASDLAQVGWHVTVVLARVRGVWYLVELGNVYP